MYVCWWTIIKAYIMQSDFMQSGMHKRLHVQLCYSNHRCLAGHAAIPALHLCTHADPGCESVIPFAPHTSENAFLLPASFDTRSTTTSGFCEPGVLSSDAALTQAVSGLLLGLQTLALPAPDFPTTD